MLQTTVQRGVFPALLLAVLFGPQQRTAYRVTSVGDIELRVATTKDESARAVAASRKHSSAVSRREELCKDFARMESEQQRRHHVTLRARERRRQKNRCAAFIEARQAVRAKEEPPARGEATEENPWQMTVWDKLALQGGWILLFCAMILVVYLFCEFGERLTKAPSAGVAQTQVGEGSGEEVVASQQKKLYDLVWGEGVLGTLLSTGIIVLSVVNFFFYCWKTENDFDATYKFMDSIEINGRKWNRNLETLSFITFLPVTIIRIATIKFHPDWASFGASAWWRYAITDIYIVLELLALALSATELPWQIVTGEHNHVNLYFFFFARSFNMLERSGAGLGVRRLRHMVLDDGKLLLTAFVMGLVVWLIMSGLYFTANRKNPSDDANWAVATYNGQPWAKFESIPSTMWYVLINLLKEHPLADAHETMMSRIWVCVVCIFAMPIFAVPASILQSSLFKAEEKEAQEEEERRASLQAAGIHTASMDEIVEPAQRPSAPTNFWAGMSTGVLVFGSILIYFYKTARETEHSTFMGLELKVSDGAWLSVDMIVAVAFLVEWIYRIATEGIGYTYSALGIIDLLAWLPGVGHFAFGSHSTAVQSRWWQSATVLRVLKLERYLHSWRDIYEIVVEQRAVLAATYLLSMLLWMLFTVLIYNTEATNPDSEMRDTFGSGMRAVWAEIINLHGEWPWIDYTAAGKAVGTVIGLFSIMLFCVPIGIFSESFKSKICDEADESDVGFDRRPWQQRCRPEAPGLKQQVYDMFYAHLHDLPAKFENGFIVLRTVSFIIVGMTTLSTIAGTLPNEVDPDSWMNQSKSFMDFWHTVFYIVDLVGVIFFLGEYAARIIATGWRHPCSFVGLCDALSLVAFSVSLVPRLRTAVFHPSYVNKDWLHLADDIMVLMRLLRLFSLESYISALHVLKNVLYLYRWPLARAGLALVSTWFIHATLLYQCEHDFDVKEYSEVGMAYRYRSILSALQYSIVHLFGDYPETDYNTFSKVIHFVGIMGGIAIIATFCGVFSGSFISYLEAERAAEMKVAATCRAVVFMKAVRQFQRAYRKMKERTAQGRSLPPPALPTWKIAARKIAYGMTSQGRSIMFFFNVVLIVAIMATMVASLPEAEKHSSLEYGCLSIEIFATLVFIAEYTIRVAAYPNKAFTFWRVLDLVCCFPGPFKCLMVLRWGRNGSPTTEAWVEALSMIRAARILEFSYFTREVEMISRAVRDATPKLAIPGYLALCVWIQTSALFMWVENYYKDETDLDDANTAESMTSVPDAMYWCCIFLTGEWANVDFTYAGSRLCIFYVIFGIAMFSIPVGILVEAVQITVVKAAEEQKEMNLLMSMQTQNQKGQNNQGVVEFAAVLHECAEIAPKRHSHLQRHTMRRSTGDVRRVSQAGQAKEKMSAGVPPSWNDALQD